MANYKVIITTILEDNDGLKSESEMTKYINEIVNAVVPAWDKAEATLIARNSKEIKLVHAEAESRNKTGKKMGYPWHCSADVLPVPDDIYVIACKWSEDSQIWIDFDIYEFDSEDKCFVDDMEIPTKLYPSQNVWWRTVAEPEPLNRLQQ